MVESGDWLTPHFNYEPRFQKPVLYYWLTAAVFLVDRPDRAGGAAVVGAGRRRPGPPHRRGGRRWYDETTGLLAGAITATSFGYFALARMALPDLPLAFFITPGHLGGAGRDARARAPSAPLAAPGRRCRGPRVPDEGPAGAGHPGARGRADPADRAAVVRLAFADIVLARSCSSRSRSPWYVAMWMQHGTEYLRGFFVGDNSSASRPLASTIRGRGGSTCRWWPAACCRGRRSRSCGSRPVAQFCGGRRDVGTIELRLLLWAVLPLVFFTLSVGKQPRYVLPVLPPLALLLGRLDRRADERMARPRRRALAAAAEPGGRGGCVLGRAVPDRPRRAALPRAAAVRRRAAAVTLASRVIDGARRHRGRSWSA